MNAPTVSVRLQAVGGDKVKAEFAQIGRTGSQSLDGLTKASRANAFQMQNAALQVGDFFVQVAGGQSATRAMAQQLPQLLGAFGLFGALAGAAFAALSPFIGKLFEGADAAEQLTKSTDALRDATKEWQDAAKASRVSLDELKFTYGELADEIERARDNTEGLARARTETALKGATTRVATNVLGGEKDYLSRESLAALDEELGNLMFRADELREKMLSGTASLEEFAESKALERQITDLLAVQGAVDDLADKYGITADEAQRIAEAAVALRDSGSVQEQAEAADALATELVDVFGSVEAVDAALPGITSGLQTIVEEAGKLSENMGFSADEAKRLADNITTALDRKDRADAYIKNATIIGAYQEYARTRMAAPDTPVVHPETGSRGGSGRRGGGGARVDPRLREAERWFERTRTAAERYAEELADLNELQQLGYIDADTYGRAVKEIGEAYGEAGDQAKFFEGLQQELKDGFLDAIVSGEDLAGVFEQLAKSIARAALEAALFNTGPFASGGGGGGGGSLLGSLFGSIFSGFRASGGPVSGGRAYVVGERGPELMVPGVSGTVIPNDALRGGARVELIIRKEPGVVAEIARAEAVKVTQAGLGEYDRRVLPQSINRYQRDSRGRG